MSPARRSQRECDGLCRNGDANPHLTAYPRGRVCRPAYSHAHESFLMHLRVGRQHHNHTASRRGFTLAETMIVLVIAGMMIALAIPRVDTTKYRADAIATIVRTTLQMAQRQAITR